MAAFAFSLLMLPGQEEEVRRIGEAFSGSGELRKVYEESRGKLGISEEKVWMQRTSMGQAMIVYWETDDPQRTLRSCLHARGYLNSECTPFYGGS